MMINDGGLEDCGEEDERRDATTRRFAWELNMFDLVVDGSDDDDDDNNDDNDDKDDLVDYILASIHEGKGTLGEKRQLAEPHLKL